MNIARKNTKNSKLIIIRYKKKLCFFAKLVKSRTIPLFFYYFCTPIVKNVLK